MSRLPSNIAGLSPLSENSDTPTSASPSSASPSSASPARGRETRNALLQKLLPPPLIHAWDFWHEKPRSDAADSTRTTTGSPSQSSLHAISTETSIYDTNLSLLHSVSDVRHFWTLFNNFSFSVLPPKTSVHLFHKSILPVWEHPRNEYGGSWTFKYADPKTASVFFRWLAVLAISEQLQEAVTVDPNKERFRDDICGISFVVKKSGATNVLLWTRDAKNELGIQRALECIQKGAPSEAIPKKGDYFYKRHRDHPGFNSHMNTASPTEKKMWNTKGHRANWVNKTSGASNEEALRSEQAVEAELEKVRKKLENLNAADADALATMEANPQEAAALHDISMVGDAMTQNMKR